MWRVTDQGSLMCLLFVHLNGDDLSAAGPWPTVAAIVAGTGRQRVPADLRGVLGKMAVIPVPRTRFEEG